MPVDGDSIYHGAVDNATGCGMLLEIARAWAALPEKPRRSAIFLAATSEEAGLLGSRYFGDHPPIPAGKIALAINYDGFQPWGRTSDVVLNGAERTTAFPMVQEAAQRFNLTISPDPRPEAGLYYRSDHFSFARVGIPAFSIEEGRELLGKPAGTGEKLYRGLQRPPLPSALRQIFRRLGFLRDGGVLPVRHADRRERRQHAQAAHVARGRRISAGAGEGGSEVEGTRPTISPPAIRSRAPLRA